jgi:hypothetical protein
MAVVMPPAMSPPTKKKQLAPLTEGFQTIGIGSLIFLEAALRDPYEKFYDGDLLQNGVRPK